MKTIRLFLFVLAFIATLPIWGQTHYIGEVITFSDSTQGVVFSLNRERTSGTVVAMQDYDKENRSWSAGYDDVPHLQEVDNVTLALGRTDGYANTCALRYAADWAGSPYSYPAFKLMLDNGYIVSDHTATFSHGWYIPSANQLRQIFAALSIAGFEEQLSDPFNNFSYKYNSSDESTSKQNADFPNLDKLWICSFDNGKMLTLKKNETESDSHGDVFLSQNRAVRDFPETNSVVISVNANNNSFGRGIGSDHYLPGHTILIGAKPEKGYRFVQWNDGNTDNPREISVVSAITYTATFENITDSYTLTANSCDAAMGSATGSTSVQCGQTATISAVPNSGYKFIRWSDGNTDASRNVKVYADATYTAAFIANSETTPRVHPGDILCTDGTTVAPEYYAEYTESHPSVTAKAIVYYVDNSGQHGFAILPKAYNWCWGAYNIDVDGLSQSSSRPIVMRDMNGSANTDAICAFFGDCTVGATLCRSFGPEWFQPSAGQLNILYAYLPKVQLGLNAIGATLNIENDTWRIMSSSECSATEANAVPYNAVVRSYSKSGNNRWSASCAF